jgi:site-specific recombinase XerD
LSGFSKGGYMSNFDKTLKVSKLESQQDLFAQENLTTKSTVAKRQNVGSPRNRGEKGNREQLTVDGHERHRKDFLTKTEMDRLLTSAHQGRFGVRDHALLLVAFRHGLRVTEAIELQRQDLDLEGGHLWVSRLKGGLSTSQPLQEDEIQSLRAYLRTRLDSLPFLFLSSQGSSMTRQNAHYLVKQAGERANLGVVHPHMLRHSCGHVLADTGTDTRLLQDWLGHRDIRHTAHYSRTASKRFEGLWRA